MSAADQRGRLSLGHQRRGNALLLQTLRFRFCATVKKLPVDPIFGLIYCTRKKFVFESIFKGERTLGNRVFINQFLMFFYNLKSVDFSFLQIICFTLFFLAILCCPISCQAPFSQPFSLVEMAQRCRAQPLQPWWGDDRRTEEISDCILKN